LPAAIDVQVLGNDINSDYAVASRLQNKMQRIPRLTDIRIAQRLDYPTLRVNVDRAKALQLGVDQSAVASDLLISLSSSFLLSPNFWLDPKNGVNYNVSAQVPQHIVDSVGELVNTPLTARQDGAVRAPQFLGNVATI